MKTKYTPPVLLDLNTRRHSAQGQGPLACVGGSTATVEGESCISGTGAYLDCLTGNGVDRSIASCVPGGLPAGDCSTGTTPGYNCVSGDGFEIGNCHVGPGAV